MQRMQKMAMRTIPNKEWNWRETYLTSSTEERAKAEERSYIMKNPGCLNVESHYTSSSPIWKATLNCEGDEMRYGHLREIILALRN